MSNNSAVEVSYDYNREDDRYSYWDKQDLRHLSFPRANPQERYEQEQKRLGLLEKYGGNMERIPEVSLDYTNQKSSMKSREALNSFFKDRHDRESELWVTNYDVEVGKSRSQPIESNSSNLYQPSTKELKPSQGIRDYGTVTPSLSIVGTRCHPHPELQETPKKPEKDEIEQVHNSSDDKPPSIKRITGRKHSSTKKSLDKSGLDEESRSISITRSVKKDSPERLVDLVENSNSGISEVRSPIREPSPGIVDRIITDQKYRIDENLASAKKMSPTTTIANTTEAAYETLKNQKSFGSWQNSIEISPSPPTECEREPVLSSTPKIKEPSSYYDRILNLGAEIESKYEKTSFEQAKKLLQEVEKKDKANRKILDKMSSKQLSEMEKILVEFSSNQSARRSIEGNEIYTMSLSEMEKVLDAWNCKGDENQPYVRHAHILENLSVRSLRTLMPGKWLNDEIVNAYLRMVDSQLLTSESRTRVLNTFFYDQATNPGARIQKLIRILDKKRISLSQIDKLVIPVNKANSHWNFITLDFPNARITLYDSLKNSSLHKETEMLTFANILQQERSKSHPADNGVFTKVSLSKNYVYQKGTWDCGVFMLRGIYCVARDKPVNFQQEMMIYLRHLICFELIMGNFGGELM